MVPLECHCRVVIEIYLVTERKAHSTGSKRLVLPVMQWPRIPRIWVGRLRRVHDSLPEVLTASSKTMGLLSLLESREVRVTGYGLIWIEQGRDLVRVRRWALFQRVSGGLEAGSYAQVRCPLIDLTRRFVTKLVCTLQVKLWEAALGTKRVLAVRVRVRNL